MAVRNQFPKCVFRTSACSRRLPRCLVALLPSLPLSLASLQASAQNVSAFADETGQFLIPPAGIPSDWHGIRAMGMGNAFSSVGNDELAVFSNPAGLARSRNPRSKSSIHNFAFPGLAVGGNQDGLNAIASPSQPSKIPQRLSEKTETSPGNHTYTEIQAYPFATFGGKAGPTHLVGFPMRSQLFYQSAQLNTASNELRTFQFSETTATAAWGIASSTRGGSFAYGLSLRPNLRYTALNMDIQTSGLSVAQVRNETKKNAVKTYAIAADVGILLTAADFWFPTFALAVRNVPTGCVQGFINAANGKETEMCGAKRTQSGGNAPTDPDSGDTLIAPSTLVDPTEVRAGFSITPRGRIDGHKVNLRLAVDVFPIPIQTGGKSYGAVDAGLGELVHAGAELFFGNALTDRGMALRAGVNDSNLTYGFTFDLLGVRLEAAHYAVRMGLRDQKRYDKRYLIGLSTGW